jgi:hypothetical protein
MRTFFLSIGEPVVMECGIQRLPASPGHRGSKGEDKWFTLSNQTKHDSWRITAVLQPGARGAPCTLKRSMLVLARIAASDRANGQVQRGRYYYWL